MGRGAALHNWKPRHETQGNSGPWPRLSRPVPCGNRRPCRTSDTTDPKRPGPPGPFAFPLPSPGILRYNSPDKLEGTFHEASSSHRHRGHHRLPPHRRGPGPAADPRGAVELRPRRGLLLLHRHRAAHQPGLHQHPPGALAAAGKPHRGALQPLRRLCHLPRHGHLGLHGLCPVLFDTAHGQAHCAHRGPALHRRGHHRRQGEPAGRPAVRLLGGERRVHRLWQPRHRWDKGPEVPDKKLQRLYQPKLPTKAGWCATSPTSPRGSRCSTTS